MLIASIGITQAESGEIMITNSSSSIGYTYPLTPQASGISWTTFAFDSSDYNRITDYYITVTIDNSLFLKTSNSTFFTCTTGCSPVGVQGTASYNKLGKIITWDFPTNTIITGSTIVLSYEQNIFDTNNFDTTGSTTGDNTLTSTTSPITLIGGDGKGIYQLKSASSVVTMNAHVGLATNETYVVSYPMPGKFAVSINKFGPVLVKNIFESSTTTYFTEASFNAIDFNSPVLTYADGLYINMTLESGLYAIALINSSGAVIPTPTRTPTINPETGVGIVFDYSDYAIGDIANISWIRTTATPLTYTDYILLTYPDDTFDTLAVSPPDSGNVLALLDQPGTYKVSFVRGGLFGDQTELDYDEATVGAETPSYIVAPAQVAIGKLFNVTYKIGWTLSQGSTAWIRTYHWDSALGQWEPTYQSFSVSGVKDVQTNASILVTKQGDYMISLCDVLQGCKASTNTKALFNGSEVTTTIATSNITIDKTTYSYGETILVKTAVDNYNWSNKQVVVDYIDYGMGIAQNQQYIQSQIENFPLYISDLTFSGAGASALRLIGKNDTGDYTLAYVNFTLSATDSEGYGLTYTGNSSCVGNTISINAIVPAGELANLSISSDDARFNKEYVINGSKIIKYTIKAPGTYYLVIRKDGEARRMIIFNTASCQAAVTPGAIGGAAMQSKTDELLGTGMFITLVVLMLFGGAGLKFGGIGGAIIGFSAGFIFCAVYGLVPLWSIFLFAIVVITAMAIILGRDSSGQ